MLQRRRLGLRGSPSAAAGDAAAGAAAGRPLRVVYCDDEGKLAMGPEAVAALQLVKGPVGVVSIGGRARQGKSFVLNQLLGRSGDFQVESTYKHCTRGAWMWSAPLKRTGLDGTEYNLVLLDTEGIDAYDQTGTIQIFSLAVLLSSMVIYNQMGRVDEASIELLSLVTEMTKHILVWTSGGRSTASELGHFSPAFVWLLRDFYLDLSEDKITPGDYLEQAMGPVQSSGRDVSSKNVIRESIHGLFPERECFTLVRPVNNEKDLQRLDQLPMNTFRPEFTSGLDAFTKFVFDRTRPKQLGARTMTGPILAELTQSFLDAINTGAVPTSSSLQAPMPPPLPSAMISRPKPSARVGTKETGVRLGTSGRYSAYVKYEGVQKAVGTFDTIEEAVAAREEEVQKVEALRTKKRARKAKAKLQKVKRVTPADAVATNVCVERAVIVGKLLEQENTDLGYDAAKEVAGMLQRLRRVEEELEEVKLPPWEEAMNEKRSSDSANERVPSSLFAAAPPEATNEKKRGEDSRPPATAARQNAGRKRSLQGGELTPSKRPTAVACSRVCRQQRSKSTKNTRGCVK